jgi:hypothetical protein
MDSIFDHGKMSTMRINFSYALSSTVKFQMMENPELDNSFELSLVIVSKVRNTNDLL